MPRSRPATKTQPKAGSEKDYADTGARPFFAEIQSRAYEPILRGESGSLRFDLRRGSGLEHWYISIDDGNIIVSHGRGRADTVVKVDGDLFDRIAQGRANAMAAQLRGALVVEGDLHLLMVFQRLFPGPPRSWTASRTAKARGKPDRARPKGASR
jgi:putative sterol carrier protein